jgi:signal transduction histidine kinase
MGGHRAVVLVLIQAFILAKRFSEAFKSVHTLSQKLMKLDAVKDEFLANTSHELRTP